MILKWMCRQLEWVKNCGHKQNYIHIHMQILYFWMCAHKVHTSSCLNLLLNMIFTFSLALCWFITLADALRLSLDQQGEIILTIYYIYIYICLCVCLCVQTCM